MVCHNLLNERRVFKSSGRLSLGMSGKFKKKSQHIFTRRLNILAQKGYMPTCEYDNRVGPGTWTEGIDYVVLDEDNISMRLSGDYRDNSNWEVVSPDEFRKLVVQDAKMVLENWREEHALESA